MKKSGKNIGAHFFAKAVRRTAAVRGTAAVQKTANPLRENGIYRRGKTGRGSFLFFSAILFPAVLLCSCAALAEGAGKIADLSAFREKTLETWRSVRGGPRDAGVLARRVRRTKDGAEFLLITPAAFPAFSFRALFPANTGEFPLHSLEFHCSNPDGYCEWSREIAGSVFFRVSETSAYLSFAPGTAQLDIVRGMIRRGAPRLAGQDALRELRNRDARVEALVQWMKTYRPAGSGADFADSKAFSAFWTPVLFPETVPASRRSALWNETPRGDRASGQEIRWDTAYSAALLPENLRALRDSGTMYRDWEEALEWHWYFFEWQDIIGAMGAASFSGAGTIRLTGE